MCCPAFNSLPLSSTRLHLENTCILGQGTLPQLIHLINVYMEAVEQECLNVRVDSLSPGKPAVQRRVRKDDCDDYLNLKISFPDIDECTDNFHNCDVTATCTNTAGSFTCVCNTGYSRSADGESCIGTMYN